MLCFVVCCGVWLLLDVVCVFDLVGGCALRGCVVGVGLFVFVSTCGVAFVLLLLCVVCCGVVLFGCVVL